MYSWLVPVCIIKYSTAVFIKIIKNSLTVPCSYLIQTVTSNHCSNFQRAKCHSCRLVRRRWMIRAGLCLGTVPAACSRLVSWSGLRRLLRRVPLFSPLFITQVRPLPPRAASRLSGLVRRMRCFVPKQRHAQCRADLGQGPGHTLKNVHTTNHQSPINHPFTCSRSCLKEKMVLFCYLIIGKVEHLETKTGTEEAGVHGVEVASEKLPHPKIRQLLGSGQQEPAGDGGARREAFRRP